MNRSGKYFGWGGTIEGDGKDERTPPLHELTSRPGPLGKAMFWGMTFPWTLAVATAVGVWLMAAPAVLQLDKAGADLCHITGALIVTVSVIAMGEPVRLLRYLNVITGAALVVGSFISEAGHSQLPTSFFAALR